MEELRRLRRVPLALWIMEAKPVDVEERGRLKYSSSSSVLDAVEGDSEEEVMDT